MSIRCSILFALILWALIFMTWSYCTASEISAEDYPTLACSPNDPGEDVIGYRIYWSDNQETFNTDQSIKFYNSNTTGEPKFTMGVDKDDPDQSVVIFIMTPDMLPIEENQVLYFAATAFDENMESDYSENKPKWIAPDIKPGAIIGFSQVTVELINGEIVVTIVTLP